MKYTEYNIEGLTVIHKDYIEKFPGRVNKIENGNIYSSEEGERFSIVSYWNLTKAAEWLNSGIWIVVSKKIQYEIY